MTSALGAAAATPAAEAAAALDRQLDAATLARLASLRLRVRRVVDGALAGLHRSRHHGASVEFAEHKEYAPGDDLRRLDWKALGKFDRYYVREYEDETELRAYLLVDCSGSMGYGQPLTKLQYAAVLAGALAYLLTRQRDSPALVAFADDVISYLPPRGRATQLAVLLRALDALRPAGATDVGRAIERLVELCGRRAVVTVISDMFDPSGRGLPLLQRLRARGHQVVLFHLLHEDELTLPFSQLTCFEAMEETRHVLVDPAGVRQAYLRELERFCEQVRSACREAQVTYRRVSTADRLDRVLAEVLRGRLAA